MKKFRFPKTVQNISLAVAGLVLALSVLVYVKKIPLWKLFLNTSKGVDLSVLSNQKTVMGKVTKINGQELKRKETDEEMFAQVKELNHIYDQDTFWTDSNTSAELELEDGTIINLQPNTMIILDLSPKKDLLGLSKAPEIKVVTGEITGNAGTGELKVTDTRTNSEQIVSSIQKEIKIKTKHKATAAKIPMAKLALKPNPNLMAQAAEKIKKLEPNPPPTPVVEVKPEIKEEPKVERKIAAEKPVVIPISRLNTDAAKIGGDKFLVDNNLTSPEKKEFYIDLSWDKHPRARSYLLKILNPQTKKVLHTYSTPNNFLRVKDLFFNGKVLYEVEALLNEKTVGRAPAQEIAFNYLPPTLNKPQNNVRLVNNFKKVYFTWGKTNFTQKYIIEVSSDASFSKVIKQETTSNFTEIGLNSGKYWWRVRSQNGPLMSDPTKVNYFELVNK